MLGAVEAAGHGIPPRISDVKGSAYILDGQKGLDRLEALYNMPLFDGYVINTRSPGRVELDYGGMAYLRLDEWSALRVDDLSGADDRQTLTVTLLEGRLYLRVFNSEDYRVRVEAGDIRFVPERDASVSVRTTIRGVELRVWKGTVIVYDQDGPWKVSEGTMVVSNGRGESEEVPLNYAGDWVRWNWMKDRTIEESFAYKGRHLPAYLSRYERALDEYGYWMETPEYGPVWVPAGVPDDWGPYRDGGWIRVREEFVWVSHEPWGWVPYHYGRWAYIGGRGWCWIPPRHRVRWSPALVVWFSDYDSIGWFPLGYREVYTGPPPVKIIQKTVVINRKVVKVYRNGRVRKAVVKRHRREFNRKRHVRVDVEKRIVRKVRIRDERVFFKERVKKVRKVRARYGYGKKDVRVDIKKRVVKKRRIRHERGFFRKRPAEVRKARARLRYEHRKKQAYRERRDYRNHRRKVGKQRPGVWRTAKSGKERAKASFSKKRVRKEREERLAKRQKRRHLLKNQGHHRIVKKRMHHEKKRAVKKGHGKRRHKKTRSGLLIARSTGRR
jgi:hypothetical protein